MSSIPNMSNMSSMSMCVNISSMSNMPKMSMCVNRRRKHQSLAPHFTSSNFWALVRLVWVSDGATCPERRQTGQRTEKRTWPVRQQLLCCFQSRVAQMKRAMPSMKFCRVCTIDLTPCKPERVTATGLNPDSTKKNTHMHPCISQTVGIRQTKPANEKPLVSGKAEEEHKSLGSVLFSSPTSSRTITSA